MRRLSGLLIHWPKIRKEFFALKHEGNMRRYWKNLHNVIGIISFPFHLIMSVTGAAMGMFTVVAVLLGALVFGPQLRGVITEETEVWPAVDSQGDTVTMPLMEDVDIMRRIGKKNISILDTAAVTSAARYQRGGWWARPARNICCLILYFVSENEWGIWGAIGLFLVVPFMRYKED